MIWINKMQFSKTNEENEYLIKLKKLVNQNTT